LATDETVYISYSEAVLIHIRLMQALGETRYGVDFRQLIESALRHLQHAAIYENADLIRQSATLLYRLNQNRLNQKSSVAPAETSAPQQLFCKDFLN
jgi:hypothetical protein